jgi:hypothetical protein
VGHETRVAPSDAADAPAASPQEIPEFAGSVPELAEASPKTPVETTDPIDTSEVATTNHSNGERIQARFLVTGESQLAWQGWRDTKLGEDCSFERDEEGTMRCFPRAESEHTYFSNSICTRAFVAVESAAAESPSYHYFRTETACGEGLRAYELGDAVEAPSTAYERDASGRCVETVATGNAFRALGAPVDATRFVSAEYGVFESSARIKGYGLIAEDGAVEVTGFVDTELDTGCMWTGTDAAACAPRAQNIDRFADRELSIPLMRDVADSCSEPTVTIGTHRDQATGVARSYRRGAAYEGDTVYGMIPQMTDVVAITAQEPYYRTGDEIAAGRLAQAVVRRDDAAATRLTAVYWDTNDGNTWFSHWYDMALGSRCTFADGNTDNALCLPDTTGVQVFYANSDCAEPVAEIDAECGDALPQFAKEHLGKEVNVRRVEAAAALSAVYQKTAGSCEARHVRSDKRYFNLSAPLPAAAFVSASPLAAPTAGNGSTTQEAPLR